MFEYDKNSMILLCQRQKQVHGACSSRSRKTYGTSAVLARQTISNGKQKLQFFHITFVMI